MFFVKSQDVDKASEGQLKQQIASSHHAITQLRKEFESYKSDSSRVSNIEILDSMRLLRGEYDAIRRNMIDDRENFTKMTCKLVASFKPK